MTRATEMIAQIEAIPFTVEGHQAMTVETAADLAHPPQLTAMSRDLVETIAIATTDVVSLRLPPTLIDMFLARRLAPPATSQSTHWPTLSSSRTRLASHTLANGGE